MEINTVKEPEAKIQLVKGSTAFQTETAEHLPRLPIFCINCGKRGSGKTTAVSNLLRMYKETRTSFQKFKSYDSKKRGGAGSRQYTR